MKTLFWQYFRARLPGMLVWVGASVVLALVTAASAPAFVEGGSMSGLMKALPSSLQAMMGAPEGLSPLDGYVATQVTKNLAVVVVLYAVLLSLSIVSREVDLHTIDFLLALPTGRKNVLLSRVGVLLVNTAVQSLAIWAFLCADLSAMGLKGSFGGYGLVMFNVWLLAVAMGGTSLLASMWVDDYSLAVKLFLGLAAGSYVLEFVMRAAGVSRIGRFFSPFSYVDPVATLRMGRLGWVDVLVLVGVGLASLAASVRVFERKQITA